MTGEGRRRFGLFEFDLRTGGLRREGVVVKLPPQPSRVLALLVDRPGEIVLRDELRAHLWGEDTFVDFERGLNFCILQVRTALGDSSENPRFVQTVPRKGYRFIAPVDSGAASAPLPPPAPPSPSPPPPESPESVVHPVRRVQVPWAILAIASAAIVAPVIWLALARDAAPASGSDGRVRLAVLPLVNLTRDPEADLLADGLTGELIAELGRISPGRLGVIARTSVMRYRNTEKPVAEIGDSFSVSYVVEGSLLRGGSQLRVATQLIKVSDQAQVWSGVVESMTGTDLQRSVAVSVARALALELAPGVASPALPRASANVEAWDAYLRGRYWLNRGGAADAIKSLDHFGQAVQLDPGFAAAWAQLPEARHLIVMMGSMAPRDAYPRARAAADRALALDRSLADAHVANGIVELWYDWRPQDAARSFERALALNPSHTAAHHDYAWSLVALGRFDEAIVHITTARDLDPLSARANTDIGWLYLQLRQPTEATRACQHTLAIQPGAIEAQTCLERAFLQRGLWDEALRAAQAAIPPNADIVVPAGNTGTARDRVLALWRHRLERMEAMPPDRWVSPHTLAVHLAMLGETERAIEQLELAYTQRVGMMPFLKTDPALDTLRAHPRFDALVQKVTSGLP